MSRFFLRRAVQAARRFPLFERSHLAQARCVHTQIE